MADEAIEKLYFNGLFKGHPAKPYYEAMDGVGYLLYSLITLDQVLKDPKAVLAQKAITFGNGQAVKTVDLDNW